MFNWIKPLVKSTVSKIRERSRRRREGAGANLVKNLFRVKPPNLTEFCKFAAQRGWSLQEFLDGLQYFLYEEGLFVDEPDAAERVATPPPRYFESYNPNEPYDEALYQFFDTALRENIEEVANLRPHPTRPLGGEIRRPQTFEEFCRFAAQRLWDMDEFRNGFARHRYERGIGPQPPANLLDRLDQLLGGPAPPGFYDAYNPDDPILSDYALTCYLYDVQQYQETFGRYFPEYLEAHQQLVNHKQRKNFVFLQHKENGQEQICLVVFICSWLKIQAILTNTLL